MKNIKYMSLMGNDELYYLLKKDLLCLKFKPGQMISENDLANEYNVSRTPIRSVISRLKNEKLIEVLPQRGSFVALLSLEDIKNAIYIRNLLESDILLKVIDMQTEEFIKKVEINLNRQKNIVQNEEIDIYEYFETDSEFHELFFELAGKKSMWSIIQNFQVSYTRFRMMDMIITKNYDKLYEEHVALFNLFKNRQKDQLNAFIKKHLFGNIERLQHYIEKEYREYFKDYN